MRSVLRSDLTRYTPKATDIPPQTPTLYHTTNRNPKIDFTKEPLSVVETSSLVADLKLTAHDKQPNSNFGYSVSVASGTDGIYMLVGAYDAHKPADDEGAAYLYRKSIDGVVTEYRLTASDGETDDEFGRSVSVVSGSDGIYALVGAWKADNGGSSLGSAYLYHIKVEETFYIDNGAAPNQKWQTKITGSDITDNDKFGESVSVASGTDGIYMLVGTPGNGPAGAAYLFHSKSGETFYVDSAVAANQEWQTKITASDLSSYESFGGHVSMTSGSGGIYALASAPGGPAYLFHSKSGETFYVDSAGATNQKWQTQITASDNPSFESVSITSGSDAIYMLAAAPNAGTSPLYTGVVYLFHSKSGEPFYIDSAGATNQKWQTRITASDAGTFREFGSSVSIASGSGEIHMLIGARATTPGGAAYLIHSKSGETFYIDSGGATIQKWQKKFHPPDVESGDSFGESVSIASGTDGIYALVGADDDDEPIGAEGSACLFIPATSRQLLYSQSFDNGFVTHAIPRSSLQYRWIQDSALTTTAQLPGYQNSSSVPYGPYDDIDYVLDSGTPTPIFASQPGSPRGDFMGISGTGVDKAGIAVLTPAGPGSANFLSKSAGTIFNVYNGPYQYASWNQVRSGYNPIVRQLVKESILSLVDRGKTITNSLGQQVSSWDGVTNYKEPVVSDDSRPLVHQVLVRPNMGSATQVTSSLKYTFSNNLSTFTRQVIRDRLGLQASQNWATAIEGTLYKKLKGKYLDPNQAGKPGNPVGRFIEMDYSCVLYPSVVNAYLNRTRERTDYAEVAGTGSDGYDRIFGTQRTFYKSDQIRSEDAPNSQGEIIDPTVIDDIDRSYDFSTSIDADFISDATSLVRLDDQSGSYAFCFGTHPTVGPTYPDVRYLQWNGTFSASSVPLTDISMSFEAVKGEYGPFDDSVYLDRPYTDEPLLIEYKSVATGTYWQDVTTIFPSTVGIYTLFNINFDPGEAAYIRISQKGYAGAGGVYGYAYDNYAIRNLRLIAAGTDPNKPALNFNSMATDGIRSFPESSSYRNYDGELMQDSDETMFSTNPLPSVSYLELYNIRVGNLSSGYVERLTEQIAGENSWYNTYEDYAADLRPHTKNRSIVPEFRMSEHIPYYIVEEADLSFRARNKKIFSLAGASITSSVGKGNAPTFNEDFINKYMRTTNSGKFISMTEEHSEGQVGEIGKVSLTCRGLKKLLPYNGFYPKDRVVQLGNLLSESLGGNVEGSFEGVAGSYPKQGWQGIVKPLMSPGILFNSIKSGIAVDYPIYTGSVPGFVGGTTNTPSDFQLNTGPNYRLPFETLIDLNANFPKGSDNPIRLVSSFVTDESSFDTTELFNYKSVWNGEKTALFEMGMHNFLAETVNFFLEGEESSAGGKLTNFKSKVQPGAEGWEFKSDRTYYMDVILRDTVEMNKFIEYSGSGEIVENLKFGASDGAEGDRFGAVVATVEGSPGEGIYALVAAPYESTGATNAGAIYLFQNKFDTTGWNQKLKITASDGGLADMLGGETGVATAIASGSDGIYMLAGAEQVGATAGAAYLFHSKSGEPFYVDSGGSTNQKWQTRITGSDTSGGDLFGSCVSVISGTDGIYMLVGAKGDDSSYLFHSKSGEPFYVDSGGSTNQKWQTKITGSDTSGGDYFGSCASMISGTGGIYMLVGSPSQNGDAGAAYLFHSKSGEPFYVDSGGSTNQKWQTKITGSDTVTGNDFFGWSASMVSGTDAIYMIIGANLEGAATEGSSYLFHSKSSETFYVDNAGLTNQKWQTKLTASDGAAFDFFGTAVSIISGSGGTYALVGAQYASSSFGYRAGKSYIFHSQSAGVAEQIMSASDGAPNQYFGYSVSLISSSVLPGDLYATMGATTASFAVSGSGAAYMFAGPFGSLSGTIGIQNVQQDYRQHGKLFGLGLEGTYDPAYAAYTPPMFYGEATARLKFSPTANTTYRLDEILENLTVEEIINVDSGRVATVDGFVKSLTPLQDQNRMPVSSSVNMFGKFYQPGVTYDATTGEAINIDGAPNLNPAWVISTRFESPVLDMSSSKYDELYTAFAPDSDMTTTFNFYPDALKRTNPRTMWTSYGKSPIGTKKITLELRNSFPDWKDNKEHSSLLDVCGFDGTSKEVGSVRGIKQFHEAVVMIPYLDSAVDGVTTEIEGRNFILIDDPWGSGASASSRYLNQKYNLRKHGVAVTAGNTGGAEIGKTTISNMINHMKNFNIPPNMDFGKYEDIEPFVIYFFPFKQSFDRDDLSDMWQGVMPKSALKVEREMLSVEHDINQWEFFGNLEDKTLISKMRFLVFKVKQIAKQNYYEITEDAVDDNRYAFKFSADGAQSAVPAYNYNWPYDYFSLVEDISIEAKYTLKNKDEE